MTFDALSTSLIFWEVLSFLIVLSLGWLIFTAMRKRVGGGGARGVFDRRYASGEITREEYLTIRDDIKRNPDA